MEMLAGFIIGYVVMTITHATLFVGAAICFIAAARILWRNQNTMERDTQEEIEYADALRETLLLRNTPASRRVAQRITPQGE